MSGTRGGGLSASKKILAVDPDHYKKIGKLGGSGNRGNRHKKGFGTHRELAKRVASIGGRNAMAKRWGKGTKQNG